MAATVLLIGTTVACRDDHRSAAAVVSADDVRRLPPQRKAEVPDVMMLAADRGRVLGADGNAVQLYLVSDYQCAACRAWFEQVLPIVRDAYLRTDKARLSWVHYPLREHPSAVRAASAAMCAAAQGQFWDASARIFAAQDRWGSQRDAAADATLDALALGPGVDSVALRACTASTRMLRQIRADIDWVDQHGIGAVPTLLVGTRRIAATAPLAAVRAAIDSAIAGR